MHLGLIKILILTSKLSTQLSNNAELLESCTSGQYMDPGSLKCISCPKNSSMVTSSDGYGCSCDSQSVQVEVARCRRCNSTEVLSADGGACVPRRCQKDNVGRLACRKCPDDYIVATQNLDGSPLREVQCIRCARGYRAAGGGCVKCDSCVCSRQHVAVRGTCVPKAYVVARPNSEDGRAHPNDLLDTVKYEYLCSVGDVRACRKLANKCVRSIYSAERGGVCRLWIQSPPPANLIGLPDLVLDTTAAEGLNIGEMRLPRGQDFLRLVLVVHTGDGGMRVLSDKRSTHECLLPLSIRIGSDLLSTCSLNLTEMTEIDDDQNLAPYIELDGNLLPIPVSIGRPGGSLVPKEVWKFGEFRRYFLMSKSVSPIDNVTTIIYAKTTQIYIRIKRDKQRSGGLVVHTTMEIQYATMLQYVRTVSITLQLEHDLPNTGVLRALEIWGGVLGALSGLYAVVQWRGACTRGGPLIALAPILAGSVADALYASALMAALQALASEASATGLTLPLSSAEENTVKAFLYSALSLKIIKVVWLNWRQCSCDIFLLDWSEYNSTQKDDNKAVYSWRKSSVAREWLSMQSARRADPSITIPLALLILQLMRPWMSSLPDSHGYRCAVGGVAWWCAYVAVAICRWIHGRLIGYQPDTLARVCRATDVSLLVFQEEFYAHYIHGRNGDMGDDRTLSGPLTTCRVVCAPKLRMVCKQLSTSEIGGLVDNKVRGALLTRFLAAFFERALEGLSWVASERSVLERLLDVELSVRDSSDTSALLYDPEPSTPSCMVLTWWGEEFNLALFDAILFSCSFLWVSDGFLSALTVLVVWQVMKNIRMVMGQRNFRTKTGIKEDWFCLI